MGTCQSRGKTGVPLYDCFVKGQTRLVCLKCYVEIEKNKAETGYYRKKGREIGR